MQNLKIFHFADCHLCDDEMFEERQACLEFIVEQAANEIPDLIICAGDVFDSRYVRLDSKSAKLAIEIFSRLGDIAPVAVVGGTPSHEGTATEVFEKVRSNYPIHVSTRPEQIALIDSIYELPSIFAPVHQLKKNNNPRAIISMVPAFTKQYLRTDADITLSDAQAAAAVADMMAGFGAQASAWDCPHILVGHFQVGGALVGDNQILTGVDIEVSREMIELAKADLVCLGHIHKAQVIGDNIFYSGSTQSQDWGELDPKGFYVHEILAQKGQDYWTTANFVETPSIKRLRVSFDFTENDADQEFDAFLYAYSREELTGVTLRFEAKVWADQAELIDVAAIKNFFESAGVASCDVIRIRLPRVQARSSNMVKLERLRDRLVERARLMDQTISESILSKADLLEQDPEQISKKLNQESEDAATNVAI